MKVVITPQFRYGFFKRNRWSVSVSVAFSLLEISLIKSYQLYDAPILRRNPEIFVLKDGSKAERDVTVYIKHVFSFRPTTYTETFYTPVEADQFARELEAGFRSLKEYLVRNSVIKPEQRIFEF